MYRTILCAAPGAFLAAILGMPAKADETLNYVLCNNMRRTRLNKSAMSTAIS
jgi:hypothetical protein